MRFVESRSVFSSDLVSTRASKGSVKNYQLGASLNGKSTIDMYDYRVFLAMLRNDPVVSRAFDLVVEFVRKAGYTLIGDGAESDLKKLKSIGFDDIHDNLFYSLLTYGDLYVETLKSELHVLETTECKLKYNQKGKIEGLVQTDGQNDLTSWSSDEFFHVAYKQIGSRIYSLNLLEPIALDYAINYNTKNYIDDLIQNLPPRAVWILKNAGDKQKLKFIEDLRVSKQYGTDLVAVGEAEAVKDIYKVDTGLLEMLKDFRSAMVSYLGIPHNWIPLANSGGANRGDAQNNLLPFQAKVRRLMCLVENGFNNILKDRYGISSELKFLSLFVSDDQEVLKNADLLLRLGYGKEDVDDYVKRHGVGVRPTAKIVNESVNNNDNDPSRDRMNEKFDDVNSELNEKGVSEKGQEKIKEKVQTRSRWYIDEVGM